MNYITTINGVEYRVEILDEHHIRFNGQEYQVDFDAIHEQPVFSLLIDGKSHEAYVYPTDNTWQVLLSGRSYQALVEDEREKRLKVASGGGVGERAEFHLKAPMPGLVISVAVEEGQQVEKGALLLILESMKMQNELKAPRAGTISRLRVKVGDSVEQHQTLMSVI